MSSILLTKLGSQFNQLRRWTSDERGSVLLETVLGAALVLTVALPFASLVSYATYSSRDLATAQGAARQAARSEAAVALDGTVSFQCGTTVTTIEGTCVSPLARGTYVAASKDTVVSLAFGLSLHTNGRAVSRVE